VSYAELRARAGAKFGVQFFLSAKGDRNMLTQLNNKRAEFSMEYILVAVVILGVVILVFKAIGVDMATAGEKIGALLRGG